MPEIFLRVRNNEASLNCQAVSGDLDKPTRWEITNMRMIDIKRIILK